MRLRFWIRQGLEMVGNTALVSLVYALLMSHEAEHSFPARLIFLLVIMGSAMQLILPGVSFKTNIALALSFGSTRREAFWGQQCYQLIQVVLLTALVGLLALLEKDAEAAAPLALGAMLVCSALGTLLGVVSVKFGVKLTALVSVMLMLTPVCIFAVLFILADGMLELIFVPSVLLPAGVAVYLLMLIPEKRTLNGFCVKL